MISERPAEIEDRAVPGHWEGDLIIGAERPVRGRHPGRTLHPLRDAAAPARRSTPPTRSTRRDDRQRSPTLPDELLRSITWDQGTEMARHAAVQHRHRHPGLLLRPAQPWQRGTNENTNGLLRQYMPKGTDLAVHTAADLDAIAASLNNRPRKTLGCMKPSEKLAELLAPTA